MIYDSQNNLFEKNGQTFIVFKHRGMNDYWPVELRYNYEGSQLKECIAFSIDASTSKLVMSIARVHPKDAHKASKLQGRSIAVGRLKRYLQDPLKSRKSIVTFDLEEALEDKDDDGAFETMLRAVAHKLTHRVKSYLCRAK